MYLPEVRYEEPALNFDAALGQHMTELPLTIKAAAAALRERRRSPART